MVGIVRSSSRIRSFRAPFLVTAVAAALLAAPSARAACGPDDGGSLGDLLGGLIGIGADHDASASVTVQRGGVQVSGELSVSQEFCGFTTVTVSGDIARGTFASVSRGTAGVDASATAGARVGIEVTLPDSSWDSFTVPDPLDPRTLPPGSSMILTQEWFANVGGTAAFRGLVASAGLEVAAGDVVAITRQSDGTVRLTVGPYEAVRSETMLGIGTTDMNIGIAANIAVEGGTLKSYVFDPSSPADLDAYRWALVRGTLTGAGSSERPHDTIQYIAYDDQRSLAGQLGPVGAKIGMGSSEGIVRVVTHLDGTVTYETTATYDHTEAVSMTVAQDYDAAGNPAGEPRTSVTFHEASDWDAYRMAVAVGAAQDGVPFEGLYPNGLTLTFDGDDWMTWRDRARETVARQGAAAPETIRSIAESTSAADFAQRLYTLTSAVNTLKFEQIASIASPADPRDGTYGPGGPLPGAASPACPPESENEPARADDLATRWCGANVDRTDATVLAVPGTAAAKRAQGAGILRD